MQKKLFETGCPIRHDWVMVSDIEPFDAPEDKGIAKTMGMFGQLTAVILQEITETEEHYRYRVICGRRRILAAVHEGIEQVHANIVKDTDHSGVAAMILIENMQRSNNPACEAKAFKHFLDAGMKQSGIADTFGVDKGRVSARLKLLQLIPELFAKLETGDMPGRAGYIAAEFSEDMQRQLAAQDKVTIKEVTAMRRQKTLGILDVGTIEIPDPDIDIAALNVQMSTAKVVANPTPANIAAQLREVIAGDHIKGIPSIQKATLTNAAKILEALTSV